MLALCCNMLVGRKAGQESSTPGGRNVPPQLPALSIYSDYKYFRNLFPPACSEDQAVSCPSVQIRTGRCPRFFSCRCSAMNPPPLRAKFPLLKSLRVCLSLVFAYLGFSVFDDDAVCWNTRCPEARFEVLVDTWPLVTQDRLQRPCGLRV